MAEQFGEEVILSSTSRAIVDGREISRDISRDIQEIDLQGDDHSSSLLPTWLSQSSTTLKCGLSTVGLLFVAFFSVLIVGLAGQSSNGNDEGLMNSQYGQAIDANDVVTNSPSGRPTKADITAVPIDSEEIIISFPNDVEEQLSMVANGLSADPSAVWRSIQDVIDTTIATTLAEGMPADYTLGTIDIETIDGNTLGGSEMSFAEINHTIIYSSSVIVNCVISDCNAAPGTVQSVVDNVSQMGAVQTVPTSDDALSEIDVVDEVDLNTIETTAPPGDVINAVDVPVETSSPTTNPTNAPVISQIVPLSDASCSESTPCGECLGSCSSEKDCAPGLLCFVRLYWDNIPGCEGPGRQGQSYCYDPYAEGLTKDDLLSTTDMKCDKQPCGKCQGMVYVCWCVHALLLLLSNC